MSSQASRPRRRPIQASRRWMHRLRDPAEAARRADRHASSRSRSAIARACARRRPRIRRSSVTWPAGRLRRAGSTRRSRRRRGAVRGRRPTARGRLDAVPQLRAGAPPRRDRLDVAAALGLGTGVNIETKLLLLEHAFERRGLQRVEFKTDARNERTRGCAAEAGRAVRGDLAQAHDAADRARATRPGTRSPRTTGPR